MVVRAALQIYSWALQTGERGRAGYGPTDSDFVPSSDTNIDVPFTDAETELFNEALKTEDKDGEKLRPYVRGMNALSLAARLDQYDEVHLLLAAGASTRCRDLQGRTALLAHLQMHTLRR